MEFGVFSFGAHFRCKIDIETPNPSLGLESLIFMKRKTKVLESIFGAV